MIADIDWPSFGYGAGALVTSGYIGSAAPRAVRWCRAKWTERIERAVARREALMPYLVEVQQKLEQTAKLMRAVEVKLAETEALRRLEAQQHQTEVEQLREEAQTAQREIVRLQDVDERWRLYKEKQGKPLPQGRGGASFVAPISSMIAWTTPKSQTGTTFWTTR